MLRAFAFIGSACFLVSVVACVGGPGALPDQGVDQTSQGGGIQGGSSEGSPSNTPTSSAGSGSKSGSGTSTGGQTGTGGSTTPPVSTNISVATYDTSCTQDSDCVAVYQGDACNACRCENAAINKKVVSTYSSQLAKAVSACGDVEPCAADCASPQVGCNPATKRCGVGVSMGDSG